MRSTIIRHITTACATLAVGGVAIAQTQPTGRARYGAFGIDLTAHQAGVKPGDDFWAYANGAWDARTQIPADKGSAGVGNLLADEAEANIRKILDDMAANPAKYGPSGKQVGDFYASWMDSAAIEAKGTAPLKPYLARIDAVKTSADLQRLFATVGYASPVGFGIIPSLSDPTRYTGYVGQGGLGMPRDYYVLEGAKYDGYRAAYRAYIQRILELSGVASASARADAIFALETNMAKDQWPPEKERDIAALNDPEDIREKLGSRLDLIIDGGSGTLEPTTVVDLTGAEPAVLRQGRGDPAPFV